MNTEQTKTRLAQLAEEAVSEAIALAQARGLGPALPTEPYQVMWMEPVDGTRSEGRQEDREEASFALLQRQINPDLNAHPAMQALVSSCEEFLGQRGEGFIGFGARSGEQAAAILLGVYFERVGSITLDKQRVAQVCADYVDDLEAPTGVVETTYLVENFRAPAPFAIGKEIKFRPITSQDIDRFGRTPSHPLLGERPWLSSSHWICEDDHVGPKDTFETFNRRHEIVEDIAAALHLAKGGRACLRLLANRARSPFLSSATMSGGRPVFTSGMGGAVVLEDEDVRTFETLYRAVRRVTTEERFKDLRFPIRRLRAASARNQQEDQLVDCVIALERLLACDASNLEVTFRFRLRGAALLPESFGTVAERQELMKRLYTSRSNVVHGRATEEEVADLAVRGDRALRAILLWYLSNADALGDIQETTKKIDDSLVSGGATWAANVSTKA